MEYMAEILGSSIIPQISQFFKFFNIRSNLNKQMKKIFWDQFGQTEELEVQKYCSRFPNCRAAGCPQRRLADTQGVFLCNKYTLSFMKTEYETINIHLLKL